jgi:type I restriction enzyme S subunit
VPDLAADLAELFPDNFEDSTLGPIPAGCGTKALYAIAEFVNGAAFKNEDFCDRSDGLPIIKIVELKNGITAQTRFSQKDVGASREIACGDLLYSWSGSPDTSLDVFRWTGPKGLLNQHIFNVLAANRPDQIFAYYLLKHLRPTLIEIARNKQTTGLGHVTVADMQRMPVLSVPAPLLERFAVLAGSPFDLSFDLEVESLTLANTRDNLLARLLSGELAVDLPCHSLRG